MKKKILLLLLCIVAGGFLIGGCTDRGDKEEFTETGRVYYVSVSGSDENNGTRAHPFLTIQKAHTNMSTGFLRFSDKN